MSCHCFTLLYIIYICASVAATNCYLPNGTDANPPNQQLQRTPFFSDGPSNIASMCCHIGDTCRSDGLCDNTYQDGSLTRDTCTDPSWNSPNCIKLCTNGTSKAFHDILGGRGVGRRLTAIDLISNANTAGPTLFDTTSTVTPCNDGSFCCGIPKNANSCCSSGQGVWVKDGKETRSNPSLSALSSISSSATIGSSNATLVSGSKSSSTSLQQSRVTVTSTPQSTLASNPVRAKSDTPSIVGGTVGGVAGVLLGCAIAWRLWRKRQQRRTKRTGQQAVEGDYDKTSRHTSDNMPTAELWDPSHANELDGGRTLPRESAARSLYELGVGPAGQRRQELEGRSK